MPARFVKLDIVDRLPPGMPPVLGSLGFAVVSALLAIGARMLVDVAFYGAGPFALTLPFVLFATLFGRWVAGVGAMTLCALYAWYVVLPYHHSFRFENAGDGPRVLVNVLSGFLIVVLAEYFRRVVRRALVERDAIAEERRLLLAELDHRVRNNFAMVASMIRVESRNAGPEAAAALKVVGGRVESIARAHEALYRGEGGIGEVPMQPYLSALCASLDGAYFHGARVIAPRVEPVSLPRDRAIALGLVVNELCTNAAKHAFRSRDDARVDVDLAARDGKLILTVRDNGVGLGPEPARDGSQGQGLLDAFAEQAGGVIHRREADRGAHFEIEIPQPAA
ncbi:sensor histidine kinase [Wenxinia saemankumensis]|uniref:histidine kinase n=1 Tax=Wenxinia saemankumensis TaxID=1447782 RepID=A0A1M6GS50_9RHOB|nr:histidine kinase dimerization/phosphoacceptor domain -containing protein [Wenxinia saemankumensis]SHJ12771.1 Two-component sensor histidine kinase, contains HisKA and HATPase domains [Wenxinia saemankumensis]